jgi:hypothetical protein
MVSLRLSFTRSLLSFGFFIGILARILYEGQLLLDK